MNVLVTGSNGQVGQALKHLGANYSNLKFIFADRSILDIADKTMVFDFFETNSINYCINCAAYTAVDKAETENATAHSVNVIGTQNLALACQAHNTQLIHISTDYVYHNHINRPLIEDDTTNPQSVYAKTKLEGDKLALETLSNTIILRTSWVYSSVGGNFVKTMLRLGNKLDHLRVVFDQIGTPTYAPDLAKAILMIIEKVEKKEIKDFGGIYHYSNEGVTTWYDFALAIFKMANITCIVTPIESKDYPTPAARPHFSVLNKEKIKSKFDLKIPHWEESLEKCLKIMIT